MNTRKLIISTLVIGTLATQGLAAVAQGVGKTQVQLRNASEHQEISATYGRCNPVNDPSSCTNT